MTSNISRRLKEHNAGKTSSNKTYRPFKLVHVKDFLNSKDARNYEKYLKIRSNKEKLLSQDAEVAELVDAQA